MAVNDELFPCVRVEGAILPTDLLQRVAAGDRSLDGLRPEDYHLVGEKVNEATSNAWTRLSRVWQEFRPALDQPASPADDSLTLKKWLLPFWNELRYGQLDAVKPFEIDGKLYPISHLRYRSPIHLVSFRQDLDKRIETGDGKRPSPHGMVQELLNRSDDHLWAFVSNGLKLRVLRDNIRLTRQAFVEFDLQAIFDGKAYADFALLWRLCHESRVKPEKVGGEGGPSDSPSDCWLERWSKAAAELGLRALEQLRDGVERAIEALGRGFLHPQNAELIRWLKEREPHAQEYYRQLLRVVYRLLFLFVAEDRELLWDKNKVPEAVRDRYTNYYSTARLRRIAEQTRGTPHTDLYQALELVLRPLGMGGCPHLGLSELGGLFDPAGTPNLSGCVIGNADLLEAVRALSIVSDGKSQRSVDYRNLGSEELGSVYESLLELRPQFTPEPASFVLKTVAGNERKTTGSYYTPTSLITCLLDAALDPVLDEAAGKPDPEAAILNLKVCDPAVGSGHFLIAAAHRIARRLAAIRTHEEEPAPDAVRSALRDVIGKCVYGVDVNPMAVELCQVALWMEAMEPGKPLSFLKHHIQQGNALLGSTPALLTKGIPDAAFEASEGDEKPYCREWKRKNQEQQDERWRGQTNIEDLLPQRDNFSAEMAVLDTLPDDTPEQVRAKGERYEQLASESNYRTSGRFLADVWCAAFVWRKAKGVFDYPITERTFRQVEANPHTIPPWMYDEVVRLRNQYKFFHWHLAFPGVFRPPAEAEKPDNELMGCCGGFDAVLGNPPWVRQEFLKPVKQLLRVFETNKSTADSSVLFLERACQITRPGGVFGMLTPNKWFRADYADGLRPFLRKRTQVRLIVDFGHTRNLFADADTFPTAVALAPVPRRVPDAETFRYVRAHDSDREKAELGVLIRESAVLVPHGQLKDARWELEDPQASLLLHRLRSTGLRVSQIAGRDPIRGLLTGLNDAFYLDTPTRDALVAADPGCEGLIRRFLRGRDVQRWYSSWANQWHIVIPSSQNRHWPWSDCENESDAERKFEETYPGIHAHLKRYEPGLRKREDQGRFWWELRACDYYDLFNQPKILVQCIAYHSQFAIDRGDHVINNKVILIPSGDLYVLAVLNSRLSWWIISRVFQHMKDEGLSVDVQFLTNLPIPDAPEELRESIRRETEPLVSLTLTEPGAIAERLERERRINELVEQAFKLNDDERALLLSSLPPRDPLQVLEEEVGSAAVVDAGVGSDPETTSLRLSDLLTSSTPSEPFVLSLDVSSIGTGQPTLWRCTPLGPDAAFPAEGTRVLLRDDGLRRGSAPLPIAAGRLALNPIAGGMEVLLKGVIPPAVLRLTSDQWKTFRPFAVLTPLDQPE